MNRVLSRYGMAVRAYYGISLGLIGFRRRVCWFDLPVPSFALGGCGRRCQIDTVIIFLLPFWPLPLPPSSGPHRPSSTLIGRLCLFCAAHTARPRPVRPFRSSCTTTTPPPPPPSPPPPPPPPPLQRRDWCDFQRLIRNKRRTIPRFSLNSIRLARVESRSFAKSLPRFYWVLPSFTWLCSFT